MMKIDARVAAIATLGFLPAMAGIDRPHQSPYVGMEGREIKSLSGEDLERLREGHGWGLSLAAELNGIPGPRHLLEMREELGLTSDQVAGIDALYKEMKASAIPLGKEFIRLERDLDRGFADRSLDEKGMENLLGRIARTRQQLRGVHLSAHLRTLPLLTEEQIHAYSELRGYDSADPCRSVPPGHDPRMWRLHNHCDPEDEP